jgi:hypothetical protein
MSWTSLMRGAWLGVLIMALVNAVPVYSAVDVYHFRSQPPTEQWIHQVEEALAKAGKNSPSWHTKRDAIESHVQDIGFFLDQAWRAARRSDRMAAEEHLRQAVALIHRAGTKQYLRPEDTALLLAMIKQQWPDAAI